VRPPDAFAESEGVFVVLLCGRGVLPQLREAAEEEPGVMGLVGQVERVLGDADALGEVLQDREVSAECAFGLPAFILEEAGFAEPQPGVEIALIGFERLPGIAFSVA